MGDHTTTLATARNELRIYHEQQQAAMATYFALAGRADKLRDSLLAVEAELREALAQLVRSTDARTAARLTSTSVRQAREALAQPHDRVSGDADTAARG